MISRSVMGALALALVFVCCSPRGDGGEEGGSTGGSPYLSGTETRVLVSTTTGRTYQVSVALPRGYEDTSRDYPVLYSLDANGEFGIVVETARMMQLEGLVPELVIVGIGYPVGHYFDAVGKRVLDLTVTEDPEWEAAFVSLATGFPPPEGSGGAPGFLGFLTDEVVPLIDSEYRVADDDRALFGHSFGGLFAFYAMLHGQGAFQRFLVASPAFWWGDEVSFEQEESYSASSNTLTARAFFSAGMMEADETTDNLPPRRYITNLRRLQDILERRGYGDFAWTMHFFEDEFHTSVVPAAVSKGLRYIYATVGPVNE